MATRTSQKLTSIQRQKRHFSESFKVQKVRELEVGKTRISEICKAYQVSDTAVYKWLNKYGIMKKKKERFIIESESDTKQLIALKKRIAELEQIIGQKQVQIEFKDKMIDLAEEIYGVDIKKKFSTQQLNTSGNTGKDTNSA